MMAMQNYEIFYLMTWWIKFSPTIGQIRFESNPSCTNTFSKNFWHPFFNRKPWTLYLPIFEIKSPFKALRKGILND